MANKTQLWLAGAIAVISSQCALATNFTQVYRDALKNDPTFKQAQATWLSTKQNLPIATSTLLPTLDITAGVNRNYTRTKVVGPVGYWKGNDYGASVTEQVLNYGNWMAISGAKSQVKAATATYLSALQSLMQRTSTAYFNVLIAASVLRYTVSEKNATWQQYVQSEQKYKVGLIAITPVYDAQATYDIQVANEISDRNAVDNALEDLRAITGKLYTNLAALSDKQVPLYIPMPRNIDKWTAIALKQNWSLVADKYTLMFDRRTIQQTAAGRYPTVNATASWAKTNYNGQALSLGKNNNTASAIGLSMDFPIYQGGLISAETQQKEYDYLNQSATLLYDHRQVVSQTRQAYLGVIAGISGVQADRQSVISNEKSLKATKAGYSVGTRTMVDLLDALSQLYSAQRTYATDQYNYILSLITLKQQAGTLSEKDISKINTWLIQDLPLIKKSFNNSYTPDKPSSDINIVDRAAGLEPTENAIKKALPGGPRRGDMPRSSDQTSSLKPKATINNQYAIQLYASNNKASAQAFISANQLDHASILTTSNTKNGPSYKVVSGHYKTFHQANSARKKLPRALRKLNPWITRIAAQQHQAPNAKSHPTQTNKMKTAAIKTAKTATTMAKKVKTTMAKAVSAKPTHLAANSNAELVLPKP